MRDALDLNRDHLSKSCASLQSVSRISAAGRAGAMRADWPAHACIRARSFSFAAFARIAAVNPRCTG